MTRRPHYDALSVKNASRSSARMSDWRGVSWSRNRSEHEALTRRLRTLLGDAVFYLAWKEGADMPLDKAVGFAQTRVLRQQAISSPPGAVG